MDNLQILHVGAETGHPARRVAAVQDHGIPSEHCYRLPCSQGRWPAKWRQQALGIQKLLKKSLANCIHLHGLYGELPFLFAAQKDRPILGTAMGGDIYFKEQLGRSWSLEKMLRHTLVACDCITAKSDQMAKRLQELGVPNHKIRILNWGVDTSLFRPKRSSLPSLGIPDGAKVILSPRLMGELYRQASIIEAFARLGSHVHLVMVDQFNGAHPYSQLCRRRCRDLGIAHRTHFISLLPFQQVPDLYATSDIAISIPSSDGLPQSVFESLACECPIILSDLEHYKGVLPENTGIYYSEVKPESLARQMKQVLADSQKSKDAQRGRDFVIKEASLHSNLEQLHAMYQELSHVPEKTKRAPYLPFYLEPWERKARKICGF